MPSQPRSCLGQRKRREAGVSTPSHLSSSGCVLSGEVEPAHVPTPFIQASLLHGFINFLPRPVPGSRLWLVVTCAVLKLKNFSCGVITTPACCDVMKTYILSPQGDRHGQLEEPY